MESCSHHRQADDLGTVKIPRLFKQLVGSRVEFGHSRTMPEHPEEWDMIIHCAGCMITQKAMLGKAGDIPGEGNTRSELRSFPGLGRTDCYPGLLKPFPELAALYEE